MPQNTASQTIVAELRARIRTGQLQPGDAIPSARQLMREFGVAIATASKAIAQLKRERLVRTKPGVGTLVAGERAPELTASAIVQAAVAIADDEGTLALTMRTVARELGVATMALYRHVPSKQELLRRMSDHVLGEESRQPKARSWSQQLIALARLQWAGYRRHPWLAQTLSMTRPQLLPNGMRQTEWVLAALEGAGLPGPARMRVAVAFLAYVRGMAGSLEMELLAQADSGQSSDEWMKTQESTFAKLLPRFPLLARLSAEMDGDSDGEIDMSIDALFECGLACFVRGIGGSPRRG